MGLTVGTSTIKLIKENVNRKALILYSSSAATVYIGYSEKMLDDNITNNFLVPQNKIIRIDTKKAVYAKATAGAQNIELMEVL